MIPENMDKFYINGQWVAPHSAARMGVENPATEEIVAQVALGDQADIDAAIAAARAAFDSWTVRPVAERIAVLRRVLEIYNERSEEFAQVMSTEMGAPIEWSRGAQVWAGQVHIEATLKAAEAFHWEEMRGTTRIIREGIGVCALITPWNWPMNQIACKVAPALVAGCTMVLKPSEIAPMSGVFFAQVCHDAGVPAGVFNLVNGTGPDVGARMSSHPDVDMVSFTGSTRAGTAVAAAHAGWRGLAEGVVEATVHALREVAVGTAVPLQGGDSDIVAWLGPCIGPQAFEVGPEVVEAFVTQDAGAIDCFSVQPGGKHLADLPALARRRLQAIGVPSVHGNDGSAQWCTVAQSARFFSHRRDAVRLGSTGRMAACIWFG